MGYTPFEYIVLSAATVMVLAWGGGVGRGPSWRGFGTRSVQGGTNPF